MSLEENFGPTPEIKIPANDNGLDKLPTALEKPALEARIQDIHSERVELENARIEEDNTKKRDELVGQLAYQGVEKELEPELRPRDSTIIQPQTRGLEDPALAEMSGVGSNWAEVGRMANKLGTAAYEKTAEWLPHSVFGRFAARAERAGIRLMNAPQEKFYEVMYRWRTERAAAAEINYEKYSKAIESKNSLLAQADAGRSAVIEKQRAAGLPTADIAIKLEGERAKTLKEIEKIQKLHDRSGKRLEDLNARKAGWAKKENDLAERTMAKIDRRLAPEKATFDALVAKREEMVPKLESLKRARDMGHQGLQELEAELKLNPTLINNVAVSDKIEGVKELLAKIDAEYNQHTKALNGIDTKMRKANNYLSGWMGYHNEEARVSAQDRRTFNPGDQNIEEEQPHEAPNLTHAPEPKTPERGHVVAAQESTATVSSNTAESAIESKESLKEATPEAYIEQWNKLFGKNEATFDLKVFTDYAKLKPKETIAVEKIEGPLKEILTKGVTGAALIYAKEGIAARCAKVRQALEQQAATKK